MKLTVVTVKEPTSVNLHGIQNHNQIMAKDLSKYRIVKRFELQSTFGKRTTRQAEIKTKLFASNQSDSKEDQINYVFSEKS